MSALIAALLAAFYQLMQLPVAGRYQADAMAVTTEVTTAQQQVILTDAAGAYMKQNMSTLLSTATATNPVIVSVPALIAANSGPNGLPAGFSSVNPYGQTWQLQITQPTAGNLRGFVVSTGGDALSDLQLAGIAAKVGTAGGFVPQNDTGVYPGGAGVIYGNKAGWNETTAGLSGVAGGHLASLIVFNNGSMQNPALYRVKVPGQDQLNVMQTALGMGGNDINNAGVINGSKLVTTNDANVGGSVRAAGEVYAGGNVRVAGVNGFYNDTFASGWYMQDPSWVRSYNDKGVYTGGEMQAGTVRANNRTITGDLQINGIGVVGGGCQLGTFSREASGRILSCKDGAWSAGGISNVQTIMTGWGGDAYAACPAGTVVTGGSCSNNQGGDGRAVYTRTCGPSGNGWYCADGNGGVCQAAAICAG